jgi:hypothetical protein
MKVKALLLRAVESLPLAVFLVYMTVMDPRAPADWHAPYFAATALALLGLVVLWRAEATLNRVYFGITLYFISGTIILLAGWPWLNAQYGRLEGTAMLLWVFAVGVGFTLFSPRGYVGAEGAPAAVRKASWLLLAITAAATAFSLAFVGRRVLSSFLPFIVVFASQAIIKAKMPASSSRGLR